MRRVAMVSVLFTACGGSGGTPDGGADAQTPGPNTVTLSVSGNPYLRYRDANGPWRKMKRLVSGDYAMYITNDYTYIVACGGAGGFDATMYAHTWSDGSQQSAFCSPPALAGRAAPATVTVTGQMVQPGTVWVTSSDRGSTSPWSFSISAPAGTHDVFGVSADHIAVRRAQAIPTDTALTTIDVDQEGSRLDLLPLTINGLSNGDQPTVSVGWFGGNDAAFLDGTATQLVAPPAAMVNRATDLELANVDDFVGWTDRGGYEVVDGTPSTTYDLLPPLAGISIYFYGTSTVFAHFGTLPPSYDDVVLTLLDSSGASAQRFDASQSWVAATGATTIGWDSAPSDYDPSWQLLVSAATFRELSAYRTVGTIFYDTSRFASAALRAVAPHDRDVVVERAMRQAGRIDPRIDRALERR